MNLEKLNYLSNIKIFPEAASTFADRVDPMFYFLVAVSIFATVGLFAALFILAVMFRRKEGEPRESHQLHAPLLEIIWTVIPFFVFIGVFVWGAKLYADFLKAPEGTLNIRSEERRVGKECRL